MLGKMIKKFNYGWKTDTHSGKKKKENGFYHYLPTTEGLT